ncbi:hypothetical protein ACFCXT_30455 [Streptomyces vinaceus]|uniref:hypothetical protein n=1 Tax=Streptomyces vinaceus TaxID=1960 RepID=UPI0035E22E8D
MTNTVDWLSRLFPEDAGLVEWSACAPLAPTDDPGRVVLGGTLKFEGVDLTAQVEIDAVREGGGWAMTAIRVAQHAEWEHSPWNRPAEDPRISAEARDRVPRIGLLARLNLHLLEAPHAYREGYVSPLYQNGDVDFEAVGAGELGEALQDALRHA